MKAQGRRGVFILVFLVLLVGFCAWWGWQIHSRAKESAGWPTVQGVVVSSGITTSSRTTTRGTYRLYYKPEVVYEYTVDGATYTSRRYDVGGTKTTDQKRAHRIAGRYEPDQAVTVYYDPDDPGYAVLEAGANSASKSTLKAVAIIVLLSAAYFAMRFMKKRFPPEGQ